MQHKSIMRFRSIRHIAVACLLVGFTSSRSDACDYLTMRDAGFDKPRDVHRLCVFGKTIDPDARAVYDQLAKWSQTDAKDLNIAVEYVAVDAPDVDWAEFGIPSAPPSMPVVALVGTAVGRQNWVVRHWEPAPTGADLALLADSPARQAIRQAVGQRLAVVVHVPAADAAQRMAEPVIKQAVSDWAEHMEQNLGLAVVTIDRSDPRERFLLSFLGPNPEGGDWLALVFGRGKFMLPLEGGEITQANLDAQLEELMAECTCLRSPRTLGVDVPMAWEQELDQKICRLKTEAEAAASDIPASQPVLDSPPTPLLWMVTVYTLAAFPLLVAVIACVLYAIRHRRS